MVILTFVTSEFRNGPDEDSAGQTRRRRIDPTLDPDELPTRRQRQAAGQAQQPAQPGRGASQSGSQPESAPDAPAAAQQLPPHTHKRFTLRPEPELADGPIPVGLLHSLTGPLSLREASLRDMAHMAVSELNAKGGLLGHRIEVHERDAKSNWPVFAEMAQDLLQTTHATAIFGGFTSASRQSTLSKVEPNNGLLFYPAPYEGEEASFNAFYTGAVPNQLAIQAAEFLMSPGGGSYRHIVLLGSDSQYPRSANKVLRYFLRDRGLPPAHILELYTPLEHMDYGSVVSEIIRFATSEPTAVICTLEGDSNMFFFQELRDRGIQTGSLPIVSLTLDEESIRDLDITPIVGHMAAASYFMSIEEEVNLAFVERWRRHIQSHELADNAEIRPINAAMEATYVAVHLWAQAVIQAGSTDVDAVRQALAGQTFNAPSGYTVTLDRRSHHLHKPVFVGRLEGNGQFSIIWQSSGAIEPAPFSRYVPESRSRVADWTYPYLCSGCSQPRFQSPVSATAEPAVAVETATEDTAAPAELADTSADSADSTDIADITDLTDLADSVDTDYPTGPVPPLQ